MGRLVIPTLSFYYLAVLTSLGVSQMLTIRGSVLDVGVDWLTLTQVDDLTSVDRTLEGIFATTEGCKEAKEVKWAGYKGVASGSSRFGTRTRDENIDKIVVVSGSEANRVLTGMCPEDAPRCTRIDLQVTILLDMLDRDLAKRYFEAMKSDVGYKSSMVGRRSIVLYDSETGQTLYVGKRGSKTFLARLYDKSSDYEMPLGSAWRLEIEFKRDLSEGVLAAVLGGETTRDAVSDILASYAVDGCGIIVPIGGDAPSGPIERKAPSSNVLRWMEKCVRPAVVRQVNNGHVDEVIEALGLTWVFKDEEAATKVMDSDELAKKRTEHQNLTNG